MRKFFSLLLLILLLIPARAETQDGQLRVWLKSLKNPQVLEIAVQGDYCLGELRFLPGSTLTLSAQDEQIWLNHDRLFVCLGETAVLTRGAANEIDDGLVLKDRLYPGDLRVSVRDGGLMPILQIPIEDYLPGVVGREMSDSFPIEALKAQAVAARTYAMMKKSPARSYDLTDTTADQAYAGYDPDHENVIAAVRATEGIVGMVDGALAQCYYTASNGGTISRPGDVWPGQDQGHIVQKSDPYDLANPRSLVNRITFRADLSDCPKLKAMLGGEKTILSIAQEGENLCFYTEDEAISLSVYDDIKDGLSLGLNKGDYERVSILQDGENFTLEMRGFGHGVGMSQRGAQQMAALGKGWRQILAFYYPGMTLETLDWEQTLRPELETLPGQGARVRVATSLNLREQPAESAAILLKLTDGEGLRVLESQDGWAKVFARRALGYVRAEYITYNR